MPNMTSKTSPQTVLRAPTPPPPEYTEVAEQVPSSQIQLHVPANNGYPPAPSAFQPPSQAPYQAHPASFQGITAPYGATTASTTPIPPPSAAPQPRQQQTREQIKADSRAALFAQCAQGHHHPSTSFGACGIITAVLLFPIGLICLFVDTEQKCDRCGVVLA